MNPEDWFDREDSAERVDHTVVKSPENPVSDPPPNTWNASALNNVFSV